MRKYITSITSIKSIIFIGTIVILLFVLFPFAAYTAVDNGGSDAVCLEKGITFTLNPDGSWVKDYHHRLKLETYYAVNRLGGETFISYNPEFQELKVLKSETTMKDGRKVPSPSNAFNEVLPASAHYFPHFSHLREMVVTHTGLERGAVIDLHYQLTTKPDFMPYFSGRELITDHFPIQHMILKIVIPTGKKLNYQLVDTTDKTAKLTKETSNNQDIYTFTFENLGSFIGEPANKDIGQAFIVFSTASDWETVFPPPAVEAVDPVPTALVENVNALKSLTGAGNEDEFYFKLQTLVSDEIANCNVGVALGGFSVRKLQDIYHSNYGTAIEKAYLLYHILKHLDIPAEILAQPLHGDQVAKDVPTMLQFGDFLIRIKGRAANDIYLNPWENSDFLYPYTDVNAVVYNLQEKTFAIINQPVDFQNGLDISGKITIGKDNEKTVGELALLVGGYFYPYRSTLEDAQKALLKVIKGVLPVSSLEIKKITLLAPGELSAVVSVEGDFFKEIYRQQQWKLEKFQFPYITEEMIALNKRKYPMNLDVPFNFRVNIELEIPEGQVVTFLSPLVAVKNDMGIYEQRVESSKPGFVAIKMAMVINKSEIVPGSYPWFRDILARYFTKEPLALIKKKG